MTASRASPPQARRASAVLSERRPARWLRRLFFAALLAAGGLARPPAPPAAAAGAVPAGSGDDARGGNRLLVVDGLIAFTGGLQISRVDACPGRTGGKPPPGLGRGELQVALLLAMANARRRIWLNRGYFVPDDRLLHSLERAARRGVDVRLVLPGCPGTQAPFPPARARYGELLAAGVRIFERCEAFAGPDAADGVWTGFDPAACPAAGGLEPDRILFDRGFARQLEQRFRFGEAAAREISLPEWRRRGVGERCREWLARWRERLG